MQTAFILLILSIGADSSAEGEYPEATTIFRCRFDELADKNYDGWPDQWTRRRGKDYPQYVKVEIREEPTPAGQFCLRIDLDGAGAVAYSPIIPAGPLYSYVLEGLVKTDGLRTSHAWLSLTFLDEKRQRLEGFASPRVQETRGWQRLRLGPVSPSSENVRAAIIGLHLEPGPRAELKGSARFTDISLGRLPRMELISTVPGNLVHLGTPVAIRCQASGFDRKELSVVFRLDDALGSRIAEKEVAFQLREAETASSPSGGPADKSPGLAGTAEWQLPALGPGFYRVRAAMPGKKTSVHRRELALAVIEPYASLPGNEFGWSLPEGEKPLPLARLWPLVSQAGVGRVKLPLWYGQQASDAQLDNLVAFYERLSSRGIELVGLLSRVPDEVRSHFDGSTSPTAADVFTADPKIWYPSLDRVLTRLAGQVRSWQFGDDSDTSFVGYPALAAKLGEVKSQIERTTRDPNLGIAWGWMNQLPEAPGGKAPWRFLSLSAEPPLTPRELSSYLAATKQPGVERWVVLQPLEQDRYDLEVRVCDLVHQLLACKLHGAEGIFIAQPFGTNRGLINDDGTPGELFLPWRTTAMTLSGASYLGKLQLPSGSENLVFVRGGQATMVLWNRQAVREVLYLGEDVAQVDVWGNMKAPPRVDNCQAIEVVRLPLFVTNVNEAITRWRMDFALESEQIPSVFGVRHRNSFRLKNHFSRGVSGTAELVVPQGWTAEPRKVRFELPPGEVFQQPFEVILPFDTPAGRHNLRVDFVVQTERTWRFSAYRHLEVGLRDMYIEIVTYLNSQGELVVDQRLVNETDRTVTLACELFAPGRQRQRTQVAGLGRGRDLKTYRLPDGKQLIGKTLWLRASEIGGPRVLNYRFVAEP